MDRQLFKRPFTKDSGIAFTCPTCENFSLQLDQGKFYTSDSSSSRKMMNGNSYWEEEWITSIYTAIFVCQNSNCEEHVVSSGTGFVSQEPVFIQDYSDMYTSTEYVCYFNPKFFQPPLHFFKIPNNCPDEIRTPLLEAFSITLLSPSSAANKVRVAIENLLTKSNIPKTTINKHRKRVRLTLDGRIEKAKTKNTILGQLEDILFAIKWLGNAGSHSSSEINLDDVFDAYELMHHILVELYQPKNGVGKLAKAIRKRKGPVKKR
ncbi:DUF4145 domain-containing protein [Acinetobacter guillouiae]|uniref:DUF4145 domain-containing protein n=1 Tax=Acinetobacter guillouiae TaxID=106649 RepID=UPI0032B38C3A